MNQVFIFQSDSRSGLNDFGLGLDLNLCKLNTWKTENTNQIC